MEGSPITNVPNIPSAFSVSPVCRKEAALVVDEKLVQIRRHNRLFAAEAVASLRKNGFECARPRLSAELNPLRRNLPDLAHGRIEDGLFPPPVRCAAGLRDESLGLRRR